MIIFCMTGISRRCHTAFMDLPIRRRHCGMQRDFDLSERECDIISKHMFPLTLVPPMHRESWIVSMADKYCALRETFA